MVFSLFADMVGDNVPHYVARIEARDIGEEILSVFRDYSFLDGMKKVLSANANADHADDERSLVITLDWDIFWADSDDDIPEGKEYFMIVDKGTALLGWAPPCEESSAFVEGFVARGRAWGVTWAAPGKRRMG